MLLITCPCCGVTAEETEFAPGGQAHIVRPDPGCDDDAWRGYLFVRENARGPHLERWRHAFGCGKWFHMARDTQTLEIFGVYDIQAKTPPEDVQVKIDARAAAIAAQKELIANGGVQ